MIINERKLNELDRNIFAIKVITKVSRFFVVENTLNDISERWLYIEEMYGSLKHYLSLYQTTNQDEYKNYLENNYSTVIELLEEQKSLLYNKFSINSLVFLENIKMPMRDAFLTELINITNQFTQKEDVIDFVYYHGSKHLSQMVDFIIEQDIPFNYVNLFKQVKEAKKITYNSDDWISISTKLNSCFLELKQRNIESEELTKWFNKLTVYRFLLIAFK